MRGARHSLVLGLMVALTLATSTLSQAAEREPTATGTQPVPHVLAAPPKQVKPSLTNGECKGMGGKVVANDQCTIGGNGCITVDKDGVEHAQCIDNKVN